MITRKVGISKRKGTLSLGKPQSTFSHVGKHSTEDECIELYGTSEGKECTDDLRQIVPGFLNHYIGVQNVSKEDIIVGYINSHWFIVAQYIKLNY